MSEREHPVPGRTKVSFSIDGRPVDALHGESLLGVARRAGADIPSLCHHPRLTPYGACRLCLVEVRQGKRTRIVTSCDYPALDGIDVRTDTEAVRSMRRGVIRLLLAMAPASPVLRNLAERHGVEPDRLDTRGAGDCILCGLCARACAEAVGAHAITFAGRGGIRTLEAPYGAPSAACVSCGACAAVCPVNARETLARVIARFDHRGLGEHKCRYTLMGLFDSLDEHPAFLKPGGG
jgi:predicted molibdopterin-dependent oxidoreductase YjgC